MNSTNMNIISKDTVITGAMNPYYGIIAGLHIPAVCMAWDDTQTGWITVKRKVHRKKVRTQAQLEVDADINNWEDVDHYGRATYVHNDSTQAFEHNGALFDIGSRF